MHGLCCSESSWEIASPAPSEAPDTYGGPLQQELGYTAFYLRYNSGTSISENGGRLATLMQQLVDAYAKSEPDTLYNIIMLGHSMGGLVIRSACDHGVAMQQSWVRRVKRIFDLGTPHQGADLEKLASLAHTTLDLLPNPVARVVADLLGLRSSGIKDLRHGHPAPAAWLGTARHYLIAGTLGDDPEGSLAKQFGDALVKVPNAPADGLVSEAQRRVFPGVHHMQLAHDRTGYAQIKTWCLTD